MALAWQGADGLGGDDAIGRELLDPGPCRRARKRHLDNLQGDRDRPSQQHLGLLGALHLHRGLDGPRSADPHSLANDNNPKVKGTVTTGAPTTIKLYKNPTCAGANPEATETVANFTSPGIPITVGDDSTTDLTATALDAASNTSPCSAKLTYIEDSSPPDTVLDGSSNNPTNDSTPTFAFHATGGSSSFECKLDAGSFSSCSSPFTTSSLSDASHTFQVRAVDTATNPDPSPASQTFTVDTGPPATPSIASSAPASPANNNSPKFAGSAEAASTVKLYTSADCTGSAAVDSGPSGPTNDQTPNFGFSSTTAAASFQCRFDAAAFAPCSGPGASHTAASALAEGAHSFAVRALNSLGTADPAPRPEPSTSTPPPPTRRSPPAPPRGAQADLPRPASPTPSSPSAEVDHFECSLDGEGLNDDPDDLGDDDWEGEYAVLLADWGWKSRRPARQGHLNSPAAQIDHCDQRLGRMEPVCAM